MSVLETKLKSQMSKSAKIARNMNKLPDEIDRLRKRIERINKKRKPTSSNIRDLEKSNKQLVTKQQKLADLQVEYTKIEKKINETKINLQKEQSRNQKKLSSMLDKNTKGNEEIMEKLLTNSDQINEISNQIKKAVNQKEIIEYDVFLSHSSLDKEDYVSKI
ncbi:TPA: NAD(+) hydrolase TirS, partial [Staphylococcus aureus]